MSGRHFAPAFPPRLAWAPLLELALREDLGRGDLTSELTIAPDALGEAQIEARAEAVICGMPIAQATFAAIDARIEVEVDIDEGARASAGQVLARIRGPMRGILAAERTALNFLGRLCGIATNARRYVDAVSGTRADIVDTRKTLPGWRVLDKYAAAAGGAVNHRFALDDGILLKDNHLAAGGGVSACVKAAVAHAPAGIRVQVEVESLRDAERALDAGAEFLLLDNRTPEEIRKIVEILGDQALLEASGGITLDNVRAYAESGVHRISIGALTHSAPVADLALEIRNGGQTS